MTTTRPRFRWALPAGVDSAALDLCLDRSCEHIEQTIRVTGGVAQPTTALSAGTWFWRLHGGIGEVTGIATSPVWEFVVAHDAMRDGPSNTSWGSNGDLNGDGFSDVVIVIENASMQRGLAVYRGGVAGVATTADVISVPGLRSVAPAGDVNGDGFADVLYQGVGPAGALTVCLLEGSASGLSASPRCVAPPEGIDDNFALELGGLGDTNLDGYADVFASQSHLFGPLNYPSFILTWRGGPDGVNPELTRFDPPSSGISLTGALAAGDIDGDGFADLAATQWNMAGGSIWIAWGNSNGLSVAHAEIISNPSSFEYVAGMYGPGSDLTNDGRSDIQTLARQSGTNCSGILSLSAARVQNVTVTATDCTSTNRGGVPIGSVDGDAFGEAVRVDSTSRHLLVVGGTAMGPIGTLLDVPPPPTGYWAGVSIKPTGRIAPSTSASFAVPIFQSTDPCTEIDLFAGGPGPLPSVPVARLVPPSGYVYPRSPFQTDLIAGSFGAL